MCVVLTIHYLQLNTSPWRSLQYSWLSSLCVLHGRHRERLRWEVQGAADQRLLLDSSPWGAGSQTQVGPPFHWGQTQGPPNLERFKTWFRLVMVRSGTKQTFTLCYWPQRHWRLLALIYEITILTAYRSRLVVYSRISTTTHLEWLFVFVVSRPGTCTGDGPAVDYKSSVQLPDEMLMFIKSYPLMDEAVPSVNHRPCFTRTSSR